MAILLLLLAQAGSAWAVNLQNQPAWTEADKKEFIEYLDSGQGAPVKGQVREVRPASVENYEQPPDRKPLFFTLELAGAANVTEGQGTTPASSGALFGPRLLAGGHLFSWIRYYGGFEYTSLSEAHVDGTSSGVDHFEFPLGLELALIPLGTPQTRYFIFRGGLTTHVFSAGQNSAVFANPLLGLQETWDIGIGYEWQLSETHWRLHVLAESQVAFPSTRFYSVGVSAGAAFGF